MREIAFEKLSFGATFLSLAVILVYLSLAWEAARAGDAFFAHPYRAAELVSDVAMKGLLLSVLLGLGFDRYLKRAQRHK